MRKATLDRKAAQKMLGVDLARAFHSLVADIRDAAYLGELLFPAVVRSELASSARGPKTTMSVARAAGLTAGIIVGQLEKAGMIRHGQLNFLKHRYRWGEDPAVPELVS